MTDPASNSKPSVFIPRSFRQQSEVIIPRLEIFLLSVYYPPIAHAPISPCNNTHLDQLVPYLPTENSRVHLLHLLDAGFHFRCGHLRLGASNHTGTNRTRLLVAVQYLRDTAMGNAQLAGDHTWSNTGGGHFNDFEPNVVGQRSPVNEHAAELVDAALTC